MSLSSRSLSTVLILVVSLLVMPLAHRQRTTALDVYEATEVREDKPGEAIAFRALSLRDDRGVITPNGLMRAKAHVEAMKNAKAARMRGARSPVDATRPLPTETAPAATDVGGEPVAMSVPLAHDAWMSIGPGNVGGRVRSILVHPTKPSTMFAGSVGGGIWKTVDGGASWAAVDDFMANLAITSMLFHPTNPLIMYAGTGEGYNNADAIRGAGIFKSSDGGTTWTQLSSTANSNFYYVLRVAISPDGRVLLAGTQTGLFRSTDGGATFTKIVGGPTPVDIDFHPTDSTRAVAGDRAGQAWLTTDGGLTWAKGALALPASTVGSRRVEIAYARGTPEIVYAVVDRDGGLVFKSVDGGITYLQILVSGYVELLENGQGWYDLALWVNPRDADDLLVGGVNLYRSRDGGNSFTQVSSAYGMLHADQHIIVEHRQFDNAGNRLLYVGNDGGVYKIRDLALLTSTSTAQYEGLNNNLAVTQFYGAAGNAATGVIVGGTQDNGTLTYNPWAGSESWDAMFGGDGGFAAADPTDPNYFYGEHVYLQVHRSTNGGLSSTFIFNGIGDAGRYANFIAPFILDPNDPRRMLAGGRSLWRSDDVKAAVPAWREIKGPAASYISAIAVAPGNSNIVWVGHNNGDVFRTGDATSVAPTWTKVDSLTLPNRFVTRITIDPFDANVVYVTFGGFVDQNIQRTQNGGVDWHDATGKGTTGLPLVPVRDLEIDPSDPQALWAATEVGIFRSGDRGLTWDPSQEGPANISVEELFVLDDYLYAVTHGRGLFRHPLTENAGTPALTFSPTSRAYPSAYVGASTAAFPVAVVNSGSAPLSVDAVRLAGTHPADFVTTSDGCTGATVPPSSSCTVQVAFRPTAVGKRAALLSVASDASGSPHTAWLAGDGVTPPATPSGTVPAPWMTRDIGAVGVTGYANLSADTFSVKGAGADVWGSVDAFRFVYQTLAGDGEIVARVASVENVASWAKAGVMIRGGLDASSAHGFMLVSAAKGLAFQRRTQPGGLTTSTSGGLDTAPVWVKLARRGQSITASRSTDRANWVVVAQDTVVLTGRVYIGLAVSSHHSTRMATALFDRVTVTDLPAGWRSRDVGSVGVAGMASESGGTFTVRGAGADIWGTTDAFHYAYRSLTGDGTIVARVASIQGAQAWTKIGVMMRGSTGPSSAHALMLVSTARGLAFQRRTTNGATSVHTAGGTGTAPRWVKLARSRDVITASVSSDGQIWTVVDSDTFTLPATILVGLVAHSHDVTTLATATFDHVSVQ